MEKLIIKGGKTLYGSVELSGAKNAALPILTASLLADDIVVLNNVPLDMEDIKVMIEIIKSLGVETTEEKGKVHLIPEKIKEYRVDSELGSKIRYTLLMMGCLLAKLGHVRIPIPGGCKIGERGFDIHVDGLRALGAEVHVKDDFIEAKVKKFKGTNFKMRLPSTGATENLLLAACMAEGHTTIQNAHTRPEVLDMINFLNNMGARISVPCDGLIEVDGVDKLNGCEYKIMSGEDEAITYITAAAVTQGKVYIKNTNISHIEYPVAAFRNAGLKIYDNEDGIDVYCDNELNATDIVTGPYPGINSDMQPFFVVLATQANGISRITDNRFLDRFQYVHELNKMGSNIKVENNTAIVTGKSKLHGAKVEATDLRGGGALVVAGLVADNETEITNVYQIDRGYENIEKKLSKLGADIRRVNN